jgi:group I intron endonuclease
MIIYRVTCLTTNKIYIGKTIKTLERRKKQHLWAANKGTGSYLHAAIRKYGQEDFVWEVIDRCLFAESLLALEKHYIKLYQCTAPRGFNCTGGGDGIGGWHPSLETRAKLSAACKNRTFSPETRARLSASRMGNKNALGKKHKFSDEHKAKLSLAAKARKDGNRLWLGRKHSPETKAKIAAASRGRKLSVESKLKLSAAHKGRIISAETRAKISAAAMGRKHSVETRKKMSLSKQNMSAETRAKMSLAMMGNKRTLGYRHSPETIKKLSMAHKQSHLRRAMAKKIVKEET